ncbi:putative dual-specificity RNA methyltransferase RlmN [Bacteroidia bacterium]|nr:putative dual-specificity RNA methyltransferase RlmN [Bacteroidia bacterium]
MNIMKKSNLFGKTLSEIKSICADNHLPAFTAKQICEWLYKHSVVDISEMSNISAKNRELLSQNYEVRHNTPIQEFISSDESKKYLFEVEKSPKSYIETVYMPSKDRHTLCMSTQAGCRMGCEFCATGQMGFKQNLLAENILMQFTGIVEKSLMTNFVYMGMGEPFDNISETMKSLEILTSDWGYAFSPRRITVSTVGIIPAIETFMQGCECHLAISMHSPFDYERGKIMPVQNKYPIKDVVKELKKYDWAHQRRLSFEYILFEGMNDSYRHIDELCKLLKGLFCRVNIINFHSHENADFHSSTQEKLEWFRDQINDRGIIATVRQSRGEDIMAACGLLSGNYEE